MTIHDEFLEILRILAEDPQASAKKPPEQSTNASDISRDRVDEESREAS